VRYCTPGMLMAAKALLDREPAPTRTHTVEAWQATSAACTGYRKIIAAVELAAARLRGEAGERTGEPPGRPFSIGEDATRLDALDKVTGRARYVEDMLLPGLLHAHVLRSPHLHARLLGSTRRPPADCPAWSASSPPPTSRAFNGFPAYSRDSPSSCPSAGPVRPWAIRGALVVASSPRVCPGPAHRPWQPTMKPCPPSSTLKKRSTLNIPHPRGKATP